MAREKNRKQNVKSEKSEFSETVTASLFSPEMYLNLAKLQT